MYSYVYTCTYKHMSGIKWNYTAFRGSGKLVLHLIHTYIRVYVDRWRVNTCALSFCALPACVYTAYLHVCVRTYLFVCGVQAQHMCLNVCMQSCPFTPFRTHHPKSLTQKRH